MTFWFIQNIAIKSNLSDNKTHHKVGSKREREKSGQTKGLGVSSTSSLYFSINIQIFYNL